MWDYDLFKSDIDKMGGPVIAANQSELSVKTLTEYYNKERTPHWVSLSRIATCLGFQETRYG